MNKLHNNIVNIWYIETSAYIDLNPTNIILISDYIIIPKNAQEQYVWSINLMVLYIYVYLGILSQVYILKASLPIKEQVGIL